MLGEVNQTQKDKYSMTALSGDCFFNLLIHTNNSNQMELQHWYLQACQRPQTHAEETQCGAQSGKALQQSDSRARRCPHLWLSGFAPSDSTAPAPRPLSSWPWCPVTYKLISANSRNSKARWPPEAAFSLPSLSLGCFAQMAANT